MEKMDYWRLCDELSVIQAALLIVDVDPASAAGEYCDGWALHERPIGYEAAKTAFEQHSLVRQIEGEGSPYAPLDIG